MREAALTGDKELARRPEADWGWIDVTSLKLVGTSGAPVDVTSSLRFIAPDDGNLDDRTVAEVPLPSPVAPGETVNVQIAWSSRVPRTFARTGAIGNYYFLGQWFPKIGVLQDTGWNCHQFHAATEFFSDFGIYDVRLTVPNGWIVGATGTERGRRDEGDRTTTHHYYAEDVHDFAWTTSPDYVERIERFGHDGLPPVSMRLLLQPEHVRQAERHFNATRAALRYYGEWFGPYPVRTHHGHRSGVAERRGGHGVSDALHGRARAGWRRVRWRNPEDVTVHEAGHQFWYGIVATNEFEHAWMDEGFNTFATARALEQFFGPQYYAKRYFGGYRAVGLQRLPAQPGDRRQLPQLRTATPPTRTRSRRPPGATGPGRQASITYFKTALWLNDARADARVGHAAAHPVDLLHALRVQASRAQGLLRGRQRSERTRPDLVLRSGLSQLERLRLRRRRRSRASGCRTAAYFGDAGKRTFSANERSADAYRTTLVVRRASATASSRSTSASGSRTGRNSAGSGMAASGGSSSRSTARSAP